jgi:hypothetical protein
MASKLDKKLKTYSALAAGLTAIGGQAFGQIVYTNIPDSTFSNDTYYLDLNKDGIVDFEIYNYSYVSASSSYRANYISANGSNEILATNTFFSSYNFPAAIALNSGENIEVNPGFWSTSGILFGEGTYSGYSNKVGKWQGAVDKYVGLKFKVDNNTHYGWARLDVANDGSSFTIKDFAYEMSPDKKIIAGMKVSGIEDTPNLENIFVYSAGKQVNINFSDMSTENTQIRIYSMSGQLITDKAVQQSHESIDLNEQQVGVYVVKVVSDSESITRKVMLK